MSKKELASGEYKQVVDVYPSRGVVEIQHPNDTSRESRENRKMFTYDAVYDKKYVLTTKQTEPQTINTVYRFTIV